MDFSTDVRSLVPLADCVKGSVTTTFSTISGVEPEYRGNSHDRAPSEAVVGIISIVGDHSWSLMLGLPRGTAMDIAQKFAGFEILFDSDDMSDVVGELANILAGDVTARLDKMNIQASLSLPTVIRGSDLELLLPDELPSLRMHFTSPEGDFWLELAAARQD